MTSHLKLSLTLLLFMAIAAAWPLAPQMKAQSPFDGTWAIDLDSNQFPTQPDVYLLQNGIYHCPACDPAGIPADGQDHRLANEPCYDTVSIAVVDDRTIEERDRKNGKLAGTTKFQVSPDGKEATLDWMETCNAKGDEVTYTKVMTRTANGPAGSHLVSGSWRTTKYLRMSENALIVTLMLEGNAFSFSDPTGQQYRAKLDGSETPFTGDLSQTTVSVKRIAANQIEQTEKQKGRIVGVTRFVVSADGRTLTCSGGDLAKGTAWQFMAHKQ